MNARRLWRGLGVVVATVLLGAAAAAALSLSESDGYEASARVIHAENQATNERLAESPRVAGGALVRAGAIRTSPATLLRNSDVRVDEPGSLVFTVRTGRADAAAIVATAYARAYRSALPPGNRATARVVRAAEAERTRRPADAAPVGAAIGLLAGLLLAGARERLVSRRQAREAEPETEAETEPGPEPGPEPEPWPEPAAATVTDSSAQNGTPHEEPADAVLIDLHCHILPGIDDGPRSFAESVELARILAAEGVEVVAATPHVRPDHPGVVPDELAGRCADLQDRLDAEGVSLRVVPGGEVDLRWARAASAEELRLVSYAQRGTDLLLETPYAPLQPSFEDELFELNAAGFRILLAHPERSRTFQQDPARLADLVGRGTLVQVTAQSLVRTGRRSRSGRLARHLTERGLAHVLASDSHTPRELERASMRAAMEATRGLGGRANWMASHAPAAILLGESLPPPPPLRPGRRPLADRLRL